MNHWIHESASTLVPLLPLPGCVLFPGVVLPIHIFEARYRAMVEAVVDREDGEPLIAMALLCRNYEPLYETKQAPIHSTVCLGRVVEHVKLSEGPHQIMLLGCSRALVVDEDHTRPFRRASLEAVPTRDDLDAVDREATTSTLRAMLYRTDPAITPALFDRLIAEGATLPRLIDLLSYYLLGPKDCDLKQRILEEPAVSVRAQILTRRLRRSVESSLRARDRSMNWPPLPSPN